jgi:hypothetical protein
VATLRRHREQHGNMANKRQREAKKRFREEDGEGLSKEVAEPAKKKSKTKDGDKEQGVDFVCLRPYKIG